MRSTRHLRLCAGALVLALPVLATSTNAVGGPRVDATLSSTPLPSTAVARPFTGTPGTWATSVADGRGSLRGVTKHVRATSRRDLRVASPTSPRRLHGVSPGDLDIPATALVAYQVAAGTMAQADPSCRLDWALLAAIGRVETDHGRYAGAHLRPNGLSRPLIRGVALDGRGPVRAVPDTDGGRLDGDKVWDRAVGPMQFLPSTWSYAGVDANGDGVRSADDINDAALAAGVYLCAAPGRLDRPRGVRAAVHRYNPSKGYVDLVVRITQAYRHGGLADLVTGTTAWTLDATHVGPAWTGGSGSTSASGPLGTGPATDGQGSPGNTGGTNGGSKYGYGGGSEHRDTGGTTTDAHLEDPVQALPGGGAGSEEPLPGDGGSTPSSTPSPTPSPTPSSTPSPTPSPTPEPDPTHPTTDPSTSPSAEPSTDPSTNPSPDPTDDPSPTPSDGPQPTPSPAPQPDPQLVEVAGVLLFVPGTDDPTTGAEVTGGQWYLDELLLDVGDEEWLTAEALADFDADGVLESNADELTGLVGQEVVVEVEEGTDPAVLHSVDTLAYRED